MPGVSRPGALGLRMLAQSMQSVTVAGFSLFLPLIRDDIAMSNAQAGLLGTAATVSNGLMHLPAGLLVGRARDPRLVFALALLVTNVGTAMLFLLDSYGQLMALQILLGPARALVFHSGMQLICTHFPPERQATAMSVFVMGAMSSNLLLGLCGPWLAETLGWRGVFLGVAGLGVVLNACQWLVDRRGPVGPPVEEPPGVSGLGTLLRIPVVRLCLVLHATRVGIGSAMMFWLPTILVDGKGIGLATMGLVVGACSLLSAPCNLAGGILADRTGRPGTVIACASVVGTGALAGLAVAESVPAVIVLALLNASAVEVGFGPTFYVAARAAGPRLAVLVNAVGAQCAVLGGAAVTYAVGVTADVGRPFTTSLLVVALVAATGAVAAVRLGPALRRSACDVTKRDRHVTGTTA